MPPRSQRGRATPGASNTVDRLTIVDESPAQDWPGYPPAATITILPLSRMDTHPVPDPPAVLHGRAQYRIGLVHDLLGRRAQAQDALDAAFDLAQKTVTTPVRHARSTASALHIDAGSATPNLVITFREPSCSAGRSKTVQVNAEP
jgi:hypothetical protein